MIEIVALPIQLNLTFANLISGKFTESDIKTDYWNKVSAIPIPMIGTNVEYGPPVIGMKNDQAKLLGVYSDGSKVDFGINAGLAWRAEAIRELLGVSHEVNLQEKTAIHASTPPPTYPVQDPT